MLNSYHLTFKGYTVNAESRNAHISLKNFAFFTFDNYCASSDFELKLLRNSWSSELRWNNVTKFTKVNTVVNRESFVFHRAH